MGIWEWGDACPEMEAWWAAFDREHQPAPAGGAQLPDLAVPAWWVAFLDSMSTEYGKIPNPSWHLGSGDLIEHRRGRHMPEFLICPKVREFAVDASRALEAIYAAGLNTRAMVICVLSERVKFWQEPTRSAGMRDHAAALDEAAAAVEGGWTWHLVNEFAKLNLSISAPRPTPERTAEIQGLIVRELRAEAAYLRSNALPPNFINRSHPSKHLGAGHTALLLLHYLRGKNASKTLRRGRKKLGRNEAIYCLLHAAWPKFSTDRATGAERGTYVLTAAERTLERRVKHSPNFESVIPNWWREYETGSWWVSDTPLRNPRS